MRRTGQGGTVSFMGIAIGQATGWSVREGETLVDDPDTSDTEVVVNVQFDREMASHRIALHSVGVISIVHSSGVAAFTVAESELMGREIISETRRVITASMRFASVHPVAWS